MEPVSAAGLALGILPLIVSTLENYEHTFQPLIIFTRGCRKEVEKFQLALKVKETAFKNACQLLLCSVTEHQREVPVMLNNPRHHYLWHEDRFQRQLSSQLGDSFEACVAAISQVKQTLDFVVRKYGGIGMLMTRSKVRESSLPASPVLTPQECRQKAKDTSQAVLNVSD